MATIKHDAFRAELLADPETRAAYDALEPKYGLLRALVAVREAAGVTQAEMARRMGTSRSALSRLESAVGPSPNWETVTRYAREAGYEIEVRLRPAAKRGRAITARIPARPVGRGGAAAKARSGGTGPQSAAACPSAVRLIRRAVSSRRVKRRLVAREGRTVLMVDQNVIAGTEVADYIYVLELGRNRIECDKAEFDATYRATIAEWLI